MAFNPRHQSRVLLDGADRAAARSFFKAIGFTDDDMKKPLVGVGHCWIEITPCNWNHQKMGREGQGRHPRCRRDADRVQYDLGHRRHRDGHRGHEGVAREPGDSGRLRRAGRAGPPAGRLRWHLRL